MIKVSVIVPVYRVPLEYLRACLNSLIAQTMQESEFILVSDGAPEVEYSICEKYAELDSRFKIFKRKHTGVSATRNYGIEQAQGEYITFVDSDDWIKPESCQMVYDYARENNSDIVLWEAAQSINGTLTYGFFSNAPIASLSGKDLNSIIANIIHTTSTQYNSTSLVCCKLFKKNLIKKNRIWYPETLKISEDRIFNILAYQNSKKISYINEVMYYYRIHNHSVSHQYIPDAFEEYCAFINLLDNKTQKKFKTAISNEIIRSFFLSWSTCYMHKENPHSFKQRIREIKNIINSDFFQKALSSKNVGPFPKIIRFEISCFRHHIFLPLYIHGLKALLKFFFI